MRIWTTLWAPRQETVLNDLGMFIDAAREGNLAEVKVYIKNDIHHYDTNGDALYEALKHGHTDCAIALQNSIDTLLSRHYYAAGISGQFDDLELCNPQIKPTESSDPLFHHIENQQFHAAYLLVKKGFGIEPIHFYAAGKLTQTNPVAANDFYRLLECQAEFVLKQPRKQLL